MLSIENTGLIVIDVQGRLARLVHGSSTLISNCEKLISGARILELPVILLEQNPQKLGVTVDELKSCLHQNAAIGRYTFNACESPEFVAAVRDSKAASWLVCGIEAHVCVYQTAKGLVDLGYHVEVVGDCVSSRALSNVQLGISRLKDCGALVTGLEMCLFELVKDCRSEHFRKVLELVR